MNRLAEYLKTKGIKRRDFAELIGVAPPYVTQICQDPPAFWPRREVFERIREATEGEITPDHFMSTKPAE